MNKNVAIILTLIFLSGLNFKTEAADLSKIGYVDLGKVFDEYQKTKDSEKELGKKGETKEAERGKIVADLRRLQDELETSSDKEKEKKQGQVEDKVKQLQDFDRETRTSLKKERDTTIRDILQEIDKVIQEYGQKGGYTLILNERALLYEAKELDLTDKIIGILNEGYKKK
jgi:outer membrane protein